MGIQLRADTKALIKKLRARGLNQSEISRRTGIPQPRISRWEAGYVPDAADDALRLLALDDPDALPVKNPLTRYKAIELLGGTAALAAQALGVKYQAVSQWPDVLPGRIADRVVAAVARRKYPNDPDLQF